VAPCLLDDDGQTAAGEVGKQLAQGHLLIWLRESRAPPPHDRRTEEGGTTRTRARSVRSPRMPRPAEGSCRSARSAPATSSQGHRTFEPPRPCLVSFRTSPMPRQEFRSSGHHGPRRPSPAARHDSLQAPTFLSECIAKFRSQRTKWLCCHNTSAVQYYTCATAN
jgi:hypothetical protein